MYNTFLNFICAAGRLERTYSPAMHALLQGDINSNTDSVAIDLIDDVYGCNLGADLVADKIITAKMICDAKAVSELIEALDLDPEELYFPLLKLYSVVKHIQRHHTLPPVHATPLSTWVATQDKFKYLASDVDEFAVDEAMVEHMEAAMAALVFELPTRVLRELKAEFIAAHPKGASTHVLVPYSHTSLQSRPSTGTWYRSGCVI